MTWKIYSIRYTYRMNKKLCGLPKNYIAIM